MINEYSYISKIFGDMRLTGIFYYFLGLKCFSPILNRDVFELLYFVFVEEKKHYNIDRPCYYQRFIITTVP